MQSLRKKSTLQLPRLQSLNEKGDFVGKMAIAGAAAFILYMKKIKATANG